MFERALPPLLTAPLEPATEAVLRGLPIGDYSPIWEVGEDLHARVRPLAAGRLALHRGGHPTGVSVPIVAYVLRAGDLTIAIDSGLGSRWRGRTDSEVPDEGPTPGVRYRPVLEGPTLAEQLHEEGLKVDLAVCTHLHVDHAGGLRDLGVPVRASEVELASALGSEGPGYEADDLAGLELAPIVLDGEPAGPFPAHALVAPGVLALATPGHTAGSISLFACLGRTWALVCGDAAYPRADEPGSQAFLGMLRIRRALEDIPATLVLPGHDTAVLRAASGGAWFGTD